MPYIVWEEDPKTCLAFEIGPPQQKLWRSPDVQLMSNLDVGSFFDHKVGGIFNLAPGF